jgi:putative endonuclease
MKKNSYVYILFNKQNGVLYTGVTSDIIKRVAQHKMHEIKGFSKKYNVDMLGYYEVFENIIDAIECEKRIKAGSRKKKIELIESVNPNWQDLYDTLV